MKSGFRDMKYREKRRNLQLLDRTFLDSAKIKIREESHDHL